MKVSGIPKGMWCLVEYREGEKPRRVSNMYGRRDAVVRAYPREVHEEDHSVCFFEFIFKGVGFRREDTQ